MSGAASGPATTARPTTDRPGGTAGPQDGEASCRPLTSVFVVVVIAAAVGGFTNDRLVVAQPFTQVSQFVWTAGLALLPAVALVHRRRPFLRALSRCSVLVLVPLLAVVSLLWSVSPVDTITGAARLALAVGLVCAVRVLAGARTWQHLGIAIAVLCGASCVFPVLDPGALDPFADGVRGVFPQKNTLGGVAAVGLLIGLLAPSSTMHRVVRVGVAVVSGAALALSQSATAVLGVAAALALVAVMHGYRARAAYFWAFVTIAPYAVVLTVAASYWREVLGWFGKDSTLTGRLSIWSDAIAAIGERPVTGYGYAAYWPWKFAEEGAGPALVAITNPHNLLLHFMLAFGVLGLVLPVAVLVAAVRPPGSAPDPGRWLTIGLIAFVALQGITEASALEPRTIGLFVVVVALTRKLER